MKLNLYIIILENHMNSNCASLSDTDPIVFFIQDF